MAAMVVSTSCAVAAFLVPNPDLVVVHYTGYPCEMDTIMAIARRHKIAVLEDVSHAHGALYKGRMVGTIGDVSAFSLMSAKSMATGETPFTPALGVLFQLDVAMGLMLDEGPEAIFARHAACAAATQAGLKALGFQLGL